ncbi:MAG: hypothetical protein ACKO3W_13950 [bacterium]
MSERTETASTSERTAQPAAAVASASSSAASSASGTKRFGVLRDAWQIPLLLIGFGGVAAAILYARNHTPKDDFAGALDQAEELIAEGEFASARYMLDEVVRPNLERAPEDVKPRYFALGADFLAGQQKLLEQPAESDARALIDAYDRAKALGWTMTPAQSISYSQALVRLGRASEALAVATEGAGAQEAEALRRRVKRDALDALLHGAESSGRSPESMLDAIDEFRADPAISIED